MEQKKPQTYYDAWKYGMKGCYYGTDAELVGRLSRVKKSVWIRLLDEIKFIRDNDDLHYIITTSDVPVMALIDCGLFSDGSKNIIENAQNKFGQGPRKI